MMQLPEIKGLRWLSDKYPDLVVISIMLEDSKQRDLGIAGLEPEQTEVDYYLDLSQLIGVRDWYPENGGTDEPSKTECVADFKGMNTILLITKEELIKAWIIYKNWKYDTKIL